MDPALQRSKYIIDLFLPLLHRIRCFVKERAFLLLDSTLTECSLMDVMSHFPKLRSWFLTLHDVTGVVSIDYTDRHDHFCGMGVNNDDNDNDSAVEDERTDELMQVVLEMCDTIEVLVWDISACRY